MDEPRAQTSDAVSVAISGLDRRIDDKVTYLREQINSVKELNQKDVTRLDEKVAALIDLLDEREKLSQLAQLKFEDTVKHNDEKSNEFRAALSDLSKEKATSRELESGLSTRDSRLDAITLTLAELRSRLDVGNPVVSSLQQQLATTTGQQSGHSEGVSDIVKLIGVVGTILAILLTYTALSNKSRLDNPAVTVTTVITTTVSTP